ncbi:antibiotic biosynthesis monooxygenase [Veronia nyctiphanis]|uniref:Antibiotic biosynthesis monooxygenase n=2 Tax=Veronia nyctiphanis TaxID=1278244 RepID=A0A4Q0YVB9_9GAMM|nr:antibiotic biosynthesis monooxygenase [Veronia nyctiphanis]
MYCIVVKNQIVTGEEDAYLKAMLENAEASVRDEPGCLTFDVVAARDEESTFYLYEVYRDQEALAEHKQTAHYLKSREQIHGLVVDQSVLRADVVALNSVKSVAGNTETKSKG